MTRRWSWHQEKQKSLTSTSRRTAKEHQALTVAKQAEAAAVTNILMRKLSLAVISFFAGMLATFSQATQDSSAYKNKKLKIEEINFVTSYYHQEGDHSPVTGGIGTEKLSDYASTIELKLNRWDKKDRKHDFSFELGVDHYTSASSDKIDPHTISSASSADTRIYPSASWTINNEKKRNTFGFYGSFSTEFDYNSIGLGTSFSKSSKDNNREFTLKLQAYLDNLKEILPIELRSGYTGSGSREHDDYPTDARNSFSASLTYSNAVSQRLQFALLTDIVTQQGYLGTPFHRIFFSDGKETNEHLPSSRFKLPIGGRLNYFAGDKVVFRLYYRFYDDNWGLTAHTASIEVPIKITNFFSLSPFYRYYTQSGVKYYAPAGKHLSSEQYYTTDDDLSPFNSNYEGVDLRFAPPGGVFKIKRLNMVEVRYGHYNRSDNMQSDQATLHLKVKL
jgi:hypothetical protein